MKNYQVIENKGQYAIANNGVYSADGLCDWYAWDTRSEAQAAANAYNAYEGEEWLSDHTIENSHLNMIDPDDVASFPGITKDMLLLYWVFGQLCDINDNPVDDSTFLQLIMQVKD